MISDQFHNDSTPCAPTRSLKIEEDGDYSKKRIRPKIRLMGRWLEKAGFIPGGRVQVVCVSPGIIELRAPVSLKSSAPSSNISQQSDAVSLG